MLDKYEKQVRLLPYILECLEYLTPRNEPYFAIKGGTALNFFIKELPRLSVDIDLTYCPISEREFALSEIRKGLQNLSERIKTRLLNAQCILYQNPEGDKLFVRHNGVSVKVEPNGIVRGTVFPTQILPLCVEAQKFFNTNINVRCLSEEDLYGSKICAALDRQHPRDLFDILPLMHSNELKDDIRLAFLVYVLSHPRPIAELLNPSFQSLEKIYQTEFQGMTKEPIRIEDLEQAREWLTKTIQNSLKLNERKFLLSFKSGDPDWQLIDWPKHIPQLPAVKWKLYNINQLRKNPRKFGLAFAKLEKYLFSNLV
jgi:hypothetical protein